MRSYLQFEGCEGSRGRGGPGTQEVCTEIHLARIFLKLIKLEKNIETNICEFQFLICDVCAVMSGECKY